MTNKNGFIERAHFTTETLGYSEAYEAWHDSISVLFDVDPLENTLANGFGAEVESFMVGSMMLARSRSNVQGFKRKAQTIARSGMDHIMIQYFERGGNDIISESGIVRVRPGDIQVIDMAQELETKAHGLDRAERVNGHEEFTNLSVIIAREHLEELVPTLHAMHLRVIPSGTPLNLILGNYILNLFSTAPNLRAREAEGLVKPTAQLLAASLSQNMDTIEFTRNSVDEALLLSVRRLIDLHLGDMTLSPDKIAAAMNISRATLFRICEPVGGVMNFVRQRRLALARRLLHSSNEQVHVKAIAYKLGFSNPSSFARAYRAEFGLSPSETKALYHSDIHQRAALASPVENGLDRRYEYWMSHIVR